MQLLDEEFKVKHLGRCGTFHWMTQEYNNIKLIKLTEETYPDLLTNAKSL
jgi:hypothetical protein